jgi:GTPase involved in cell partitioning and DNA repair
MVVEKELEAFDPDLMQRPRLICGSKLDAAVAGHRERLESAAAERRVPCHFISSATGAGIPELRHLLQAMLRQGAV